jgi:hypothetical protein
VFWVKGAASPWDRAELLAFAFLTASQDVTIDGR